MMCNYFDGRRLLIQFNSHIWTHLTLGSSLPAFKHEFSLQVEFMAQSPPSLLSYARISYFANFLILCRDLYVDSQSPAGKLPLNYKDSGNAVSSAIHH